MYEPITASGGPLLLLDFYGTVSSGRYWECLPRGEFERVNRYLFQERRDIVQAWMTGRCNAEQVVALASSATGLNRDYLWASLVSSSMQLAVPDAVQAMMAKVAAHAEIVMLTENTDCFSRFTWPHAKWREHVNGVVNSHAARCRKVESLLAASEHLQHRSSVYLVDDSEPVVAAARDLGIVALHTSCPEETPSVLAQVLDRLTARPTIIAA